jgi:YVTN family beta-propeller protein
MTVYSQSFIINDVEYKKAPIRVGIYPTQIFFDEENKYLYVSNTKSHTVSIIKTRSNYEIINLMVGTEPYGLMHDNTKDYIYISNLKSNNIYLFDDENFNLIANVTVGKMPTSIISLYGDLYVTNFGNDTISIVDHSKQMFNIINLKSGKNPIDLIAVSNLNPRLGDDRVYVVNKGSNYISVINPLTHQIIANISTGIKPFTIDYNPHNKKVYVANNGSNYISIIDPLTNTNVTNIPLNFTPTDLVIDKNNNYIYISEKRNNSTNIGTNAIHIINGSTNSLLTDRKVILERDPERLALDSNNGILYISNPSSNSISIVDFSKNKEIKTKLISNDNLSLISFLIFDLILLISINVILSIIIYYHFLNITTRKISRKETKDIVFTSMFSLIITPIILVIFNFQYLEIKEIFLEIGLTNFSIIITLLLYVNIGLYLLTAIIFFSYPPYPFFFFYFFKDYFHNIGEDIAVIEYTYFKYYYISLALLLLLVFTPIIFLTNEIQSLFEFMFSNEITIENILENPNWRMVHGVMLLTFIISSFKLLLVRYYLIKKYKLRLVYAKGWLKMAITHKEDEIAELKYLINCFSTYNRYLEDNFNLYIDKLESLFSQLSKIDKDEKDKFIVGLAAIFISDNKDQKAEVDEDELSPVRYIAKWLNLSESEQLLVKKSLIATIRSFIETIGIIIPIIIGIVEVYFRFGGHV